MDDRDPVGLNDTVPEAHDPVAQRRAMWRVGHGVICTLAIVIAAGALLDALARVKTSASEEADLREQVAHLTDERLPTLTEELDVATTSERVEAARLEAALQWLDELTDRLRRSPDARKAAVGENASAARSIVAAAVEEIEKRAGGVCGEWEHAGERSPIPDAALSLIITVSAMIGDERRGDIVPLRPAFVASIDGAIGRTLAIVGLFDAALPHLRRAADDDRDDGTWMIVTEAALIRTLLWGDHDREALIVAKSLQERAAGRLALGQVSATEASRVGSMCDDETIGDMVDALCAEAHARMGDEGEAERLLRRRLARFEGAADDSRGRRLDATMSLVDLLLDRRRTPGATRGETSEALRLSRELVESWPSQRIPRESTIGPIHRIHAIARRIAAIDAAAGAEDVADDVADDVIAERDEWMRRLAEWIGSDDFEWRALLDPRTLELLMERDDRRIGEVDPTLVDAALEARLFEVIAAADARELPLVAPSARQRIALALATLAERRGDHAAAAMWLDGWSRPDGAESRTESSR